MPGEAHLPYFMGGVAAFGGVFGYARSRSVMSLVGGAGVGLLYVGAGHLIENGEAEKGHLLGLGTSALLMGMMGKRYVKTQAVMPAGALAAMGAAGVGYHGLKWNEWRK